MTDMTTPTTGTVTIYSTSWCIWCDRAKRLLDQRGARYVDVDIEQWDAPRERLEQIAGQRSVPQIFVGSTHVGGFEELAALDADGALGGLLSAEGVAVTA